MSNVAEVQAAVSGEALVERLFSATIGTLEIASIHVGGRLGLYRSLAAEGPATASEFATRTGTVERYVREWLEQQAVAGFLTVDDPGVGPQDRRYALPADYHAIFVEEENLSYLTPMASLAIAMVRPIDQVLEAFRSGGGVNYEAYEVHGDIGAINRPQFVNLVAGWLGSIPEIDARLRAQPPARVADLACGTAWSSIAIARAYPGVLIDAVDVDADSIATARANIEAAGLGDRVRPVVQDASNTTLAGTYDLVTIFEALHDMNHPVEALRQTRANLAEGGSVLIADERVAEGFTAPGNELERLNYGFSVLHCLMVGTLDEDSAGTGTVIRPGTVREYAAQAGFGRVDVLPIEHDFWRFYRLVP